MPEPMLLKVQEALQLGLHGIIEQAAVRRRLLESMVGTLYTRIVQGEIEVLEEELRRLTADDPGAAALDHAEPVEMIPFYLRRRGVDCPGQEESHGAP